MKNKINIIFAAITVLIVVACIVHTLITYVQIRNDVTTSAPANVALFLIVPYAICLIVDLLVWYFVGHKK